MSETSTEPQEPQSPAFTAPGTLTPVLTDIWDAERSWSLETYRAHGGYQGLARARELGPEDLVCIVKESEPGTCKDIPTILANPHALIEGIAITSRAIGCDHAFVYLRGEVAHVYRRLLGAVREATEAGLLATGFGLDGAQPLRITAHAGAGAYICGEETALLDSLEGRRGHPRLKPPFPAVAGLYARPTVVNNVETIASVPAILARGAQWYAAMGTEKSKGHGIFSVSGHVAHPGQYEAPFGITMPASSPSRATWPTPASTRPPSASPCASSSSSPAVSAPATSPSASPCASSSSSPAVSAPATS